jgi:16S rRNA (cytosine967-C5)-methyltransferase
LRARLLIQDEASQIVALTAGARPGERVLDACAAPGGKTLVMAEAMGGQGQLIAGDYRAARMRLLAAALKRAGARASLVQIDAGKPLPFGQAFDRVLLDAPCSGLGIVRRDPDIKWTRSAADQVDFARRQGEMLRAAADAIRPGGTLVYATCSSEPEENEGVVDALVASRDDMSLVVADPGPAVLRGAELVDDRGMLRTLPFRHGLDAFFCAVLVRRQAA